MLLVHPSVIPQYVNDLEFQLIKTNACSEGGHLKKSSLIIDTNKQN